MIYRTQLRRLIVFSGLLLLGFSVILGRLVYVQLYLHESLTAKAFQLTQRTYLKQTKRGDILDRHGSILASTQRLKILCADPSRIGDYYVPLAKALAEYLGADEGKLLKRLKPREYVNSAGETVTDPHVRLKLRISEEEWQGVREFMKTVPLGDESLLDPKGKEFLLGLRRWGIFTEPMDSHRRVYLNGQLASHILGFAQMQERVVGNQTVFYSSGKSGIEYTFDSHLQGVLGWRMTETDSRRRELVALRSMDVDPVDGLNVHLTIDMGVQAIVEDELTKGVETSKPLSASVVVLQPHTGEILALANYPTYDPNHPGDFPTTNRRNRAISDVFEPGSTFKILSVSSALDAGVVDLSSRFDCENGYIHFMGKGLRDDHAYSILSVQEIIKKSSNIGAFKVARRLGEDQLFNYLKKFGIGDATGISLPAERTGTLRTVDKWSGLSISRIPIGYEVSVTPLQITLAVAAVANGGWLMNPMLVRNLTDAKGNIVMNYYPQRIRRAISEEAAFDMTKALETVVEAGGTATRARLEYHTVAGKTGTARKYVPGKGYTWSKYNASFIGFLPSERPEIVISVVFNEPKGSIYGGVISGPVFKAIATRLANYLNLTPSKELRTQTTFIPKATEDYAQR